MFCSECGQKTEGDFCDNCGAPVAGRKRNPKLLYGIIGGVVLIAIVVGIILLAGGGGGGSPEAVVKDMYRAMEKADVDLFFKLIDPVAMEELGEFKDLIKPMMKGALEEVSAEMKAQGAKMTVIDTRITGDVAEVDIEITGSEGTETDTVILQKRDGKWYIDFEGVDF